MTNPARAQALEELKRAAKVISDDYKGGPWRLGKPEEYWFRSEAYAKLYAALSALTTLPAEAEVERVELTEVSGFGKMNATYVGLRGDLGEKGWKFYAERPVPPPPAEPSNEELAGILERWAECVGNDKLTPERAKLAAQRLRSTEPKR